MGFIRASPVLAIVFKKTGGLVWKEWPMNHTRRANSKERLKRVRQVEAVLRVCSQAPANASASAPPPPSAYSESAHGTSKEEPVVIASSKKAPDAASRQGSQA
eukprot:TRINITY_DN1872_c0_g1_i1.p2 TRINITY_DN1872_c0_g1~~TRINITY_DN1872_c0_g1_i1.p2  ORF type:complete len:103 (-),score=19.69 TRINITY_DN1872_c0_g1_i1:434-742(-)